MSQDASNSDARPADNPDHATIAGHLKAIFRGHRADPADPEHRCLCGYDGEDFEDHLAWATLRDMKDVGYEVWPVRHG